MMVGSLIFTREFFDPTQNGPKSYIQWGDSHSYKGTKTVINDNLFNPPPMYFYSCAKDRRYEAGYIGFTTAQVADIHARITNYFPAPRLKSR